jgi:hypothetical protein
MSNQHSSNQNPLSQDSQQQSLNTSIAMLAYLAGSLPVKPNPATVQDGDEPLRYLTLGEVDGLRHCIHCVRGVLENAYEQLLEKEL